MNARPFTHPDLERAGILTRYLDHARNTDGMQVAQALHAIADKITTKNKKVLPGQAPVRTTKAQIRASRWGAVDGWSIYR